MDIKDLRFKKGSEHNIKFPVIDVPNVVTKWHNPGHADKGRIKPFDYSTLKEEMLEVLDVAIKVRNNEYPEDFMDKYWPKHWGEFDRHAIAHELFVKVHGRDFICPKLIDRAEAVRMDDPIELALVLKDILKRMGEFNLKSDKKLKYFDFLGHATEFNKHLNEYMHERLVECFKNKWWYGVPRPEEVFNFYFPELDCKQFTAYKKGCPPHPSYPAGHGTLAGAILSFFLNNLQLSTDGVRVCRDTCYRWSMWRSWAFVHYAQDNIEGMLTVGGGY